MNAFPDENAAKQIVDRLKNKGYNAYVTEVQNRGKPWFRVSVGKYNSREEADKDGRRSEEQGELSESLLRQQVEPSRISMEIRQAIDKLVNRIDLSEAETIEVMNQIMTGEATPLQVAAFLTALRMKGETVDEITGAARVMREKAHRVNVGSKTVLDTCGTGGDQKGTFNISTTSAFVARRRRGSRSRSMAIARFRANPAAPTCSALWASKSMRPRERVEQCIAKIGIGFLFAPLLHEAMKYAVQPRRDIGIRTIFNLSRAR